jgi:hypothetical protein
LTNGGDSLTKLSRHATTARMLGAASLHSFHSCRAATVQGNYMKRHRIQSSERCSMNQFFQFYVSSLPHLFKFQINFSIRVLSDIDQWLKTDTIKKLKHNVDIEQSPRISQDTSNTLWQNSEKAQSLVLRKGKKKNTVRNT